MRWALILVAAAVALLVFWLRERQRSSPYRGAVQGGSAFYCPHCKLEVSAANPMVSNISGHRVGLHTFDRWCQVCEKNAEQHLIHR